MVTSYPSPEPWSPPQGDDLKLITAGVHWDAVKVPRRIGERAIELLGDRSGAVIEDRTARALYWLVPSGSMCGDLIHEATVLGAACHVAVPPIAHTGGHRVYWRVLLESDRYLTDADRLCVALELAAAPEASVQPDEGDGIAMAITSAGVCRLQEDGTITHLSPLPQRMRRGGTDLPSAEVRAGLRRIACPLARWTDGQGGAS